MPNRTALLILLLTLSLGAGAQQDDAPPADEAAPTEVEADDERAAEDAAVEAVLEDAELIYGEDEETDDFVPSQEVSADQLLDYPVDI